MAQRIRSRLTYANVVSTLCLFLVLGGGAYAATELKKNSVGSEQLAPGAVATSDISKKAVAPVAKRAKVADQVPQILLPNSSAKRKRASGASAYAGASCSQGGGSLIQLNLGESCQIEKPPFTITVSCTDRGGGTHGIDATVTSSVDGWILFDKPYAAGEQGSIGAMAAAKPQSQLFGGPTVATPNGEALILGNIGLGVYSLADCWGSLYGVG